MVSSRDVRLNILKSINGFCHTKRFKKKDHMIMITDLEKTF